MHNIYIEIGFYFSSDPEHKCIIFIKWIIKFFIAKTFAWLWIKLKLMKLS